MAANGYGQNIKDNGNPNPISEGKDNGVVPTDQKLQYTNPIARISSSGASLRRLFNVPVAAKLNEDAENEVVSQAGDIGDRELNRTESHRLSSLRFSMEHGIVFPVPEDLLESYEFYQDPSKSNVVYPLPISTSGNSSPGSNDNQILLEKQEEPKELPPSLEYVACLVYLTNFAILGVLSRYLIKKLFSMAAVTSYNGILYLGLPTNMVGCFLMGWLGVVFKANISHVSDQLVIGLTTGYLGSLTAFSSWIQQMLDLSVHGRWAFTVIGFIIGLFLSSYSFNFGIETAKGFKWLLIKSGVNLSTTKLRRNNIKRHSIVLFVLMCMWGGLWAICWILEKKEFSKGGSGAQLWLACFVGPPGVWVRWWLARLNGRGLGQKGSLKWIPFGTLIANVSAVCIMAALAILMKAVNTKKCETVATAVQFGFIGCLSTVPAFIAEFNAMRQSTKPWRAYVYANITIGVSFALGTLIYSVPFWIKGYH